MICKECEKYKRFGGNNGEYGVCSLLNSFFPTQASKECVFLNVKKYTCEDCTHFGNDYGCLGCDEKDDICSGFEDALKEKFFGILFDWLKRNKYNKAFIMQLCDEFENDEITKFIIAHLDKQTISE